MFFGVCQSKRHLFIRNHFPINIRGNGALQGKGWSVTYKAGPVALTWSHRHHDGHVRLHLNIFFGKSAVGVFHWSNEDVKILNVDGSVAPPNDKNTCASDEMRECTADGEQWCLTDTDEAAWRMTITMLEGEGTVKGEIDLPENALSSGSGAVAVADTQKCEEVEDTGDTDDSGIVDDTSGDDTAVDSGWDTGSETDDTGRPRPETGCNCATPLDGYNSPRSAGLALLGAVIVLSSGSRRRRAPTKN